MDTGQVNPPPSSSEGTDRGPMQHAALAFAGGFGLAVPLMAAFDGAGSLSLLVGVVVGAVLGQIVSRSWWAALAGLVIGVLAWSFARGALDAQAPVEDTFGSHSLPPRIGTIAVVMLTGICLLVSSWTARRRSAPRRQVLILGFTGLAALAGFVLTWGVLALDPAGASFEIPLTAGWTVIPRPEVDWFEQPAFGDDLTAVYGATEVPEWGVPIHPVIGVTVIRASQADWTGDDCYRALDYWMRPSTVLYGGKTVDSGEVTLPVGEAHFEVRAHDTGGSLVYGYGVARTRQVGMFVEHLCYILAISLPPDSPIDEAGAQAIAASVRFK